MQEISIKVSAGFEFDDSSVKKSTQELANLLKNMHLGDIIFSKESIENIDKITKAFANINREVEKLVQNLNAVNGNLKQGVNISNQNQGQGYFGYGHGRTYHGGGIRGYVSQYLRQKFGPIGEFLDNVFEPVLSVASGYGIYKLAQAGANIIRAEDQYAVVLGTRIGTYGSNFDRVRADFGSIGRRYNLTTLETMPIADAYMSVAGTRNLLNQVSSILYASKAFRLDPQYLANVFGSFSRMGNADIRGLSEAFAGAIKRAGMQGREEELIDALHELTQATYQHQLTISKQAQQNLLGYLTYFSSIPGMNFDKAKQLTGGLEGLIESGASNPELMAIMGYGTKYRGTQGYWELRMRLSKGLTDPRNLRDLIEGINRWIGDPYLKRIWLDKELQQFGVNNPALVEKLLDPRVQRDILSGRLTRDEINRLLQMGRPDLQRRYSNSMQSNAEMDNRWNVFWQDVQKALGEPLLELERLFQGTIDSIFSPEVLAGTIFGGWLFGNYLLRGSFSRLLGRFFGGGGTPRGGVPRGGARASTGSRVSSWLSRIKRGVGSVFDEIGSLFNGIGKWFDSIVPPIPPAFKAILNDNGVAMGDSRIMQTSALGLAHYSLMNLPAYGINSYRARTLEARKEDLIYKEMQLLNKKETVLRMEQSGLTSVASRGNNFDLERIFSNLSANTREMLKQVSHTMITFLSASGGFGSTSYFSGGWSPVSNTMNLKDGFNMPASEIDAWINKYAPPGSVMRGMGQAFHEAAARTGLDVRYLVAHAAHETGWGTSHIAKSKYNFYGINAVDWNPYGGAYRFSSPADGIIRGAEWIAQNYINRGQNTLYSMNHNGGRHEYASDKQWDEKIAKLMATAPKGPTATLNVNVNVNGNVHGLTPVDTSAVTQAIVRKINSAPDLSYIFRQGVRGVAW